MSRRISFFHKAVFHTDVKRFWWVPVLHTIWIALFCLVPFEHELTFLLDERGIIGTSYYDAEFVHSIWANASVASYLVLFVVPVVLSMLLFSYLNKKSAVATAHAQPVTRLSLYITHTAFGLAALIVPVLINAVILLFIRTDPEVAQLMPLSHVWTWVYTVLSYSFIAFTFTTLIGMFTGNTVAQPVFAYIFAALPYFAELMLKVLSQQFLYGYANSSKMIVEEIYFGIDALVEPSKALTYIGFSLLIWILGYLVYRLRHLENHGEIIAFSALKPVFVYGVAVCTGFLGFSYITALTDHASLFYLIPFGILGLIIANMISKKSFTLRGVLRPGVALLVTVFALFGVFYFDTTGFESKIPKLEDVEYAIVSQNTYHAYDEYYDMYSNTRVVEKEFVPKLTRPEDMENVIKFHQYKTETRTPEEDRRAYMYVHYNLKNGESLTRRYPVHFQDDKEFLKPIMETKESKTERFPILEDPMYTINILKIEDDRLGNPFATYLDEMGGSAEEKALIARLTDALKKDLMAVPYEEFIEGYPTLSCIRINRRTELVYDDGKDTPVPDPENYVPETEETYYIRESYINTIAILRELGFYDALPTAEDYTKVTVEKRILHSSNSPHVYAEEIAHEEEITDPVMISELYRYLTETQPSPELGKESGTVTFVFQSPHFKEFRISRNIMEQSVPERLKYLFE